MVTSVEEMSNGDEDPTPSSPNEIGDQTRGRLVRDPYLHAVSVIRAFLNGLNYLHRQFGRLPRWARVLFGVATFVASAYFSEEIQGLINGFFATVIAPIAVSSAEVPFYVWVILFMLSIISIQLAIISYKLESRNGEERLETDGGFVTDGGSNSEDEGVESSGSGALGGAAAGAAIGSTLGPGGAIGGAILGAILGDEIEKSSIENRRRTRTLNGVEVSVNVLEPEDVPLLQVEATNHRPRLVYLHVFVESLYGEMEIEGSHGWDTHVQYLNGALEPEKRRPLRWKPQSTIFQFNLRYQNALTIRNEDILKVTALLTREPLDEQRYYHATPEDLMPQSLEVGEWQIVLALSE